jgi:hypothetical protein
MTEAEWLAWGDPESLRRHVCEGTSERKLRLFAVDCFRSVIRLLPDPRQHQAIVTLDELAEGIVDQTARRQAAVLSRRAFAEFPSRAGLQSPVPVDDPHFVGLMLYREFASSSLAHHAMLACAGLADGAAELARQMLVFRDIFGNPFRPVTLDPSWLTSTVTALARGMYDSRDFSAMPILADALQDAGCANADVLDHCRGDGPHVRGCWVVDLVLGKR